MKPSRSLALLLGFVALTGCDQDAVQISSITAPVVGARVKFFNFGINAPQVNFYAGNTKVTAISSTTGTESTVGVAYGAVAAGNNYIAMPPGQTTFSGRISAAVDKDLPIAAIPATVEDRKAYSVYLAGFYNTATKQTEGFVVQDNFPDTLDFSQALVRFVNASPNAQPMQLTLREPVAGTEITVGGAIAYRAAGAFVGVPTGSYDLTTRNSGSTTVVITRTAVSFLPGRVYTVTARGDMTLPSTGTAVNRPFLDNSINR
jgi:hypothetical protein